MLNKYAMVGRLTADPELRETPTGVKVCTFSLACERDYTIDDGTCPVDFFRCVAYRNVAANINQYLKKGKLVDVSGRLQTTSYFDERSKKNVTIVELAVDTFHRLSWEES